MVIKNYFKSLRGFKKNILSLFFSIIPAVIAVIVIYTFGKEVYLPIAVILLNFYFAIGVGWITSPLIGLVTGISPIWIVVFLVFISSQSSLIVAVNYDILEKIPYLGKLMINIRKKADKVVQKNVLAKNISFMGLFWLMFLPIYGTGPMVMSMVGRILSLQWWKVWLTITISAILRFSLVVIIVHYGFLKL
ncbi:MAG: hypothetical protein ACOC85_01025 [Thermoplasmatota archaeon]